MWTKANTCKPGNLNTCKQGCTNPNEDSIPYGVGTSIHCTASCLPSSQDGALSAWRWKYSFACVMPRQHGAEIWQCKRSVWNVLGFRHSGNSTKVGLSSMSQLTTLTTSPVQHQRHEAEAMPFARLPSISLKNTLNYTDST